MRDLEIRGAGNVLGAEQHGHMEAVGYDLYCKMLNQAVLALKGEETEEESYATSVECDIDAYIPAAYIKNEYQKLMNYINNLDPKAFVTVYTVADMRYQLKVLENEERS